MANMFAPPPTAPGPTVNPVTTGYDGASTPASTANASAQKQPKPKANASPWDSITEASNAWNTNLVAGKQAYMANLLKTPPAKPNGIAIPPGVTPPPSALPGGSFDPTQGGGDVRAEQTFGGTQPAPWTGGVHPMPPNSLQPTGSAYAPGSIASVPSAPVTDANGLTLQPLAGANNPGVQGPYGDGAPPPATQPPPGAVPPPAATTAPPPAAGGGLPRASAPPPVVPGTNPGDITTPAGSHGRIAPKLPGDGSSAIIAGSSVPKPEGTEDPMIAASWYMASAPGFYGQGITQQQVADTINTYRSDPQGLDYTDWMGIFHPEMTNSSSQPTQMRFSDGHVETVMPAAHYQNRSDPAALKAAQALQQTGYKPGQNAPPDPTAQQKAIADAQAAMATSVPGSQAYIDAQKALAAAQNPPAPTPKPGDKPPVPPPASVPPLVPPGTVPPPAATPPPPGATPPPPAGTAPPPPAGTPPGTIPQGSPDAMPLAAYLHNLLRPGETQAQSDLADRMRAQGALTGATSSGGFGTTFGTGMSREVSAEQGKEADLLAGLTQSQQKNLTDLKIAQMNSDTQRYGIDSNKAIAEMQDSTQRFGIKTTNDLQRWLNDASSNTVAKYGIDNQLVMAKLQAQTGLSEAQIQAGAQITSAQVNAAVQSAIADKNNAAANARAQMADDTNRLGINENAWATSTNAYMQYLQLLAMMSPEQRAALGNLGNLPGFLTQGGG